MSAPPPPPPVHEAPKAKTRGALPIAQDKIEAVGIEEIGERLAGGKTLTKIASELEVSTGALFNWIEANPERSARVRACRALSARIWDDKATEVIEAASEPFELAKAKELSHHYRWRSSKIAPKEYGDKLDVTHDGKIELDDSQLDARIAAIGTSLSDAIIQATGGRPLESTGGEE